MADRRDARGNIAPAGAAPGGKEAARRRAESAGEPLTGRVLAPAQAAEPAEGRSAEGRSAESRSAESRSAESWSVEGRAGGSRRSPAVRYERIALVDLLDRLLAGGVVISGEVRLSIADVDLVNVSLRALISSVSSALEHGSTRGPDDS